MNRTPEEQGTAHPEDWLQLGREVLDIERCGLEALSARLDQSFVTALELLAACRGRVVLTGIGKSGLVARKIAATFSSTGTPALFLHPVEGAHGDLGMLRAEDLLLAISYSGETDELNAILPALRSLGLGCIALTGRRDSALARMADVVLDCSVPREACHLDLAPTASTTAALAMGDALAVCLMRAKSFGEKDFLRVHPGGALGRRLSLLVSELMHREDLPLVREDTPLQAALEVMTRGGLGAVCVLDAQERLAGILTDGDLRRLLEQGRYAPERPVGSVMTRSPRHGHPQQTAAQLLDLMERHAITVLPVLDQAGRVAGLVHLHDLLGKGRLRFG